MLSSVAEVAPGLLGPSVHDWTSAIIKVRNVQAHRLPEHDDFGEGEISEYYVLGSSGSWAGAADTPAPAGSRTSGPIRSTARLEHLRFLAGQHRPGALLAPILGL